MKTLFALKSLLARRDACAMPHWARRMARQASMSAFELGAASVAEPVRIPVRR